MWLSIPGNEFKTIKKELVNRKMEIISIEKLGSDQTKSEEISINNSEEASDSKEEKNEISKFFNSKPKKAKDNYGRIHFRRRSWKEILFKRRNNITQL